MGALGVFEARERKKMPAAGPAKKITGSLKP